MTTKSNLHTHSTYCDGKNTPEEMIQAAIKAGWNTGREELETLVHEVLSGRVKYCPHGRPVAVTVSRKDLEKLFLRIV